MKRDTDSSAFGPPHGRPGHCDDTGTGRLPEESGEIGPGVRSCRSEDDRSTRLQDGEDLGKGALR